MSNLQNRRRQVSNLTAQCAAAASLDPDAYVASYDSDDESDDSIAGVHRTADPTKVGGRMVSSAGSTTVFQRRAAASLALSSKIQAMGFDLLDSEAAGAACRLRIGLLVAVHTLATAPQETWRAVQVTAGAAGELIALTAEQGMQDMARKTSIKEDSQPATANSQAVGPVKRARERWEEASSDMPEVRERVHEPLTCLSGTPQLLASGLTVCWRWTQGAWGKIQWLWDQPPVKKLRITISMAQWSVRLPAIMALLATQMGLLASQV